MNIVHICLTGGYTERFTYQENYLTKYHSRMGNKVTLITTQYCWHKDNWGKCLDTNYQNQDGTEIIRIPYKYNISYKINTYIGRFVGLYDLLENIKPHLIFIHNLQFNDIDQIVKYKKKHNNIKIVVDNHSDFSNSARNWITLNVLYKLYWRRNARKIKDYAEHFYGVLPARVEFLEKIYKLPGNKCELLVMGSDDEEVERVGQPENQKKVRRNLGIVDTDFVIVTGGKIDAWKKQTLTLMRAVKELKEETIKLIVFGNVANEIKEEFDKLCDENRVKYVGWANASKSYDFFSVADLVVFPGRHSVYWEEVAGLGIPMVCKYWPGTTHVDLGGNVIFLKEDSVEEIKKAILDIFNSPDKYKEMKRIAEEKGMEVFSYRKISQKAITG